MDFLARTAKWTPRWFNKPKFHILHLTAHIRRFGPATIFATEGFESFNTVIRSKSVHSNRHAPSKDIALAFAHGSRIRHLLSGAYFPIRNTEMDGSGQRTLSGQLPPGIIDAREAGLWRQVGRGPLGLVERPNIVTDYLGLDPMDKTRYGKEYFELPYALTTHDVSNQVTAPRIIFQPARTRRRKLEQCFRVRFQMCQSRNLKPIHSRRTAP